MAGKASMPEGGQGHGSGTDTPLSGSQSVAQNPGFSIKREAELRSAEVMVDATMGGLPLA